MALHWLSATKPATGGRKGGHVSDSSSAATWPLFSLTRQVASACNDALPTLPAQHQSECNRVLRAQETSMSRPVVNVATRDSL